MSTSNWSCELPSGESSRPFGQPSPFRPTLVRAPCRRRPTIVDPGLEDAVRNLRRLIVAAEHYRHSVSVAIGLGPTESQAVSSLALHGDRGQSELARDLRLTTSASTALVDRLERQGVAERIRHPHDRRRTIVRLTERGQQIVAESQACLGHALRLLPPEELARFTTGFAVIAADLDAVSRGIVSGEIDPVPTRALPAP